MSLVQLASQIVVIFLLMLLGALIRQCGFLHEQSINDMTNVTLYFLSPLVIIKAFEKPFSVTRIKTFMIALVGVFITYAVMIGLARLIFGRVKESSTRQIAQYGSIYSNNGFMGVPLAQALFGSDGVFYAVVSLVGFNIMNWTHGVGIFRQTRETHREKLRHILLNPNIIAIIIGIIFFVNSVHLPAVIDQFIGLASNAFTPLSMIIIGSNLAGMNFKDIKLAPALWGSLVLRNLIFPLLGVLILKLLGVTGVALMTTTILSACPVAGLVVLFSLQSKGDTKSAVVLMSISTILSLLTIPVVFMLMRII